jgi:hypothetical protein
VAARLRADPLFATAPPARSFVLLEVPGPWHRDLLRASGLGPDTLIWLRHQLAATGARLLLIRRPGRHPAQIERPRRWAISAIDGRMHWGHWREEADLRTLDLVAALASATGPVPGRPPVALICTHGRHDLCCALQGREVAAAATTDPRVDVWECSHLGGDRFAANLLWLPSGLLFGGLSAGTVAPVMSAALNGHVVLEHFRGRCGDTPPLQAAQWLLMGVFGESRPDRIAIETPDSHSPSVPSGPTDQVRLSATYDEHSYQVDLTWSFGPAQKLTCSATTGSRVRTFHLMDPPQLIS